MVKAKFKLGQWVNRKTDGKAGIIEFIAHMYDETLHMEAGHTKEEQEIVKYAITWEDGDMDELANEDELE